MLSQRPSTRGLHTTTQLKTGEGFQISLAIFFLPKKQNFAIPLVMSALCKITLTSKTMPMTIIFQASSHARLLKVERNSPLMQQHAPANTPMDVIGPSSQAKSCPPLLRQVSVLAILHKQASLMETQVSGRLFGQFARLAHAQKIKRPILLSQLNETTSNLFLFLEHDNMIGFFNYCEVKKRMEPQFKSII